VIGAWLAESPHSRIKGQENNGLTTASTKDWSPGEI
jgi:hypothetical protein